MTEKLIRTENEAIECLKNNKPRSGYYMLQESVDIAIKALEEIQAYRAIGTVEELKALKEKSVAKKLKHDVCPNCSTNNDMIIKHLGNPQAHKIVYCWNCGQKLDWE